MGRTIRKVPPYWVHPTRNCPHSPWKGGCDEAKRNNGKCFMPIYDENYDEAVKNWNDEITLWNKGEHPTQVEHKQKIQEGFRYQVDPNRKGDKETCERLNNPNYYMPSSGYYYWNYAGNPPKEEYYRKYKDEEATWFQLYENVSEGTPVTPSFSSEKELINFLVEVGDAWDGKWSRESAEHVVYGGYAPSMVFTNGKFYQPNQMGDISQPIP